MGLPDGNKKIDWYDWKYVLQAWHDKLSRGGISIHAVATVCKRSPEDLLAEILADKTPGVGSYICGSAWIVRSNQMGLVGLTFNPYRMEGLSSHLKLIKETLEKYPWPEFKGFQKWKGQEEASFEGYNNSKITINSIRIIAQRLAKQNKQRIIWGKGILRNL